MRLVPWLSWAEWARVKDGLGFSSPTRLSYSMTSLDITKLESALAAVAAWRARGRVPAAVEASAAIRIAQMRDSMQVGLNDNIYDDGFDDLMKKRSLTNTRELRRALSASSARAEYALAIVRFVNAMCERTVAENSGSSSASSSSSFSRNAIHSVAAAAETLGLPHAAVDIRHDSTHSRSLPALPALRRIACQCCEWLSSRYWMPQALYLRDSQAGLYKALVSYAREVRAAYCALVELQLKELQSQELAQERLKASEGQSGVSSNKDFARRRNKRSKAGLVAFNKVASAQCDVIMKALTTDTAQELLIPMLVASFLVCPVDVESWLIAGDVTSSDAVDVADYNAVLTGRYLSAESVHVWSPLLHRVDAEHAPFIPCLLYTLAFTAIAPERDAASILSVTGDSDQTAMTDSPAPLCSARYRFALGRWFEIVLEQFGEHSTSSASGPRAPRSDQDAARAAVPTRELLGACVRALSLQKAEADNPPALGNEATFAEATTALASRLFENIVQFAERSGAAGRFGDGELARYRMLLCAGSSLHGTQRKETLSNIGRITTSKKRSKPIPKVSRNKLPQPAFADTSIDKFAENVEALRLAQGLSVGERTENGNAEAQGASAPTDSRVAGSGCVGGWTRVPPWTSALGMLPGGSIPDLDADPQEWLGSVEIVRGHCGRIGSDGKSCNSPRAEGVDVGVDVGVNAGFDVGSAASAVDRTHCVGRVVGADLNILAAAPKRSASEDVERNGGTPSLVRERSPTPAKRSRVFDIAETESRLRAAATTVDANTATPFDAATTKRVVRNVRLLG